MKLFTKKTKEVMVCSKCTFTMEDQEEGTVSMTCENCGENGIFFVMNEKEAQKFKKNQDN